MASGAANGSPCNRSIRAYLFDEPAASSAGEKRPERGGTAGPFFTFSSAPVAMMAPAVMAIGTPAVTPPTMPMRGRPVTSARAADAHRMRLLGRWHGLEAHGRRRQGGCGARDERGETAGESGRDDEFHGRLHAECPFETPPPAGRGAPRSEKRRGCENRSNRRLDAHRDAGDLGKLSLFVSLSSPKARACYFLSRPSVFSSARMRVVVRRIVSGLRLSESMPSRTRNSAISG